MKLTVENKREKYYPLGSLGGELFGKKRKLSFSEMVECIYWLIK